MKTIKIFSALSFVLIFCAVISASSAGIDKKLDQVSTSSMIRHHVNIIVSDEQVTCNRYLVEILNGNGQLVAPAKAYIPGVSSYDFYERGPAAGIRYAVLVRATYQQFVCETELFTKPAQAKGPFDAGMTYRYDLYPQTSAPKE